MTLRNLLIVGPPRSGTTAIQGAICASLGSHFMPESNYLTDIFGMYRRVTDHPDPLRFDYYLGGDKAKSVYARLVEQTMDGLADAKSGEVRVFKDPMMSAQFPRARQLLDASTRVLAIVRHPADVLASLKRVRMRAGDAWDIEADIMLAYRCYDGIRNLVESPANGELVVRFEDVIAGDSAAIQSISNLIGVRFDPAREAAPAWLSQTGAFNSAGYGRAITAEMAGPGHSSLDKAELRRVQDALSGALQVWSYERR